MNLFSISQLAQYSGIKPHTIRVWEQRYNALQPDRSEKNTRYYNGEQLRRLLNIVSLLETDYKVSELCSMSDDKLSSLILDRKGTADNEKQEYFVSQLISAGMSYDDNRFEELFEEVVAKYGLEKAYEMIIHPMLVRVGVMWSANAIPSVQEHFISNLVRQKILRSIDSLPATTSESNKWLLFLPEDEFHELGLLFASFVIQKSGHRVVYLGSSVTSDAVSLAIQDLNPKYLLLFIVRYNVDEHFDKYLERLIERFDGRKIYLAGNHKLLSQVNFPDKTQWLQNIYSLEEELKLAKNN